MFFRYIPVLRGVKKAIICWVKKHLLLTPTLTTVKDLLAWESVKLITFLHKMHWSEVFLAGMGQSVIFYKYGHCMFELQIHTCWQFRLTSFLCWNSTNFGLQSFHKSSGVLDLHGPVMVNESWPKAFMLLKSQLNLMS